MGFHRPVNYTGSTQDKETDRQTETETGEAGGGGGVVILTYKIHPLDTDVNNLGPHKQVLHYITFLFSKRERNCNNAKTYCAKKHSQTCNDLTNKKTKQKHFKKCGKCN